MKLHLDWARPILLSDGARQNLIYVVNTEKLPDVAGIYVFGRRFGTGFEALYVGKANSIPTRIKGQLNNLKLMQHLKTAKAGRRVLLVGKFVPKSGQQTAKCLRLIERALIRHFLSEGHDLVNIQGTRLRRHVISSAGKHPKRFFPKLMYLERARRG